MKLSKIAEDVIALADAIRAYWDIELPKRHRDYPLVHPGEDSGAPPAEEKTLKNLLSSLPGEVVYKIALILYLGRGDFGTDELAEQYEALQETFENPNRAICQMLDKVSLADYLRDGLDELKQAGIDVDDLAFRPVPSAS